MTLPHLLSRQGDGQNDFENILEILCVSPYNFRTFSVWGEKIRYISTKSFFWGAAPLVPSCPADDHKKDQLENPHRPLAADTLEWNKHEPILQG